MPGNPQDPPAAPDPAGDGAALQDAAAAGQRPTPATRQPKAKPGQLRDAYLPNLRVRIASDIATLCAIGILIGLLATLFTWTNRSELFDLASSELQNVKMGIGYLAGPVLILVALPLVFGRSRQVALKHGFRRRLLMATLLWIVGMVVLIVKVTGLGDEYTINAGTYITSGFLIVGLLATLAMWPTGLEIVQVDRSGKTRESPDA